MANKSKRKPRAKTAKPIPRLYDYGTYQRPSWSPLPQATFDGVASTLRTALRTQSENHLVLLRVRQVDWQHSDVYVLCEKEWPIARLMRDVIATQMHGGAVDGTDVVVFLPLAESKPLSEANISVIREESDEDIQASSNGRPSVSTSRPSSALKENLYAQENQPRPQRQRAEYFKSIVQCFPEAQTFVYRPTSKATDVVSPQPVPFRLPFRPGFIMPASELQALLTEQAEAEREAERLATHAAVSASDVPRRRQSFAQLPGLPFGRRPRIELPEAVEVWYDIASYTETVKSPVVKQTNLEETVSGISLPVLAKSRREGDRLSRRGTLNKVSPIVIVEELDMSIQPVQLSAFRGVHRFSRSDPIIMVEVPRCHGRFGDPPVVTTIEAKIVAGGGFTSEDTGPLSVPSVGAANEQNSDTLKSEVIGFGDSDLI
ncbi:hypothetical protein HDU85_003141 [Gaertneriomyces sp. JEL0708]|nr:hypothetical protein HDU85_003141 [Gaertneriomyces sp. JEL0708]